MSGLEDFIKNIQNLPQNIGNTLGYIGGQKDALINGYQGITTPLGEGYDTPSSGQVLSEQYKPTPTATLMPTPTTTPIPGTPENPYLDLIKEYFPDKDPVKWSNVMFRESSFNPLSLAANLYENGKFKEQIRLNPPKNREEWKSYRNQYPSIDVGLMQINTAKAVSEYLEKLGLTYYDLLQDPKLNIQIASDLYYGRIPYTRKGMQNWQAAIDLEYANAAGEEF